MVYGTRSCQASHSANIIQNEDASNLWLYVLLSDNICKSMSVPPSFMLSTISYVALMLVGVLDL